MEKRKKISTGIGFKRYFLSWFILVFTYAITEIFNLSRFWDYTAWIIAILASILFFSLKKVEFNKDVIFFNNKKVDYESIIGLRNFEINHRQFYIFQTNSKSIFRKFYFTQLGGISYFSLAKIFFSKKNAAELPIAEFLSLLDEKSKIMKK